MNRDMAKGARFSFYGMQFLMGCVFWIASVTNVFIMSEEVYGAAVAWPSEWWAGGMMGPAALYLIALFINGRRWWTAYVRMTIGAWMMLYYSAFVALGFPSCGLDLIVIASSIFMAKAAVMLVFDARDWARGPHGRN